MYIILEYLHELALVGTEGRHIDPSCDADIKCLNNGNHQHDRSYAVAIGPSLSIPAKGIGAYKRTIGDLSNFEDACRYGGRYII